MAALSGKVVGLLVGAVALGGFINLVMVDAVRDTQPIAVGSVTRTNSTGNQTSVINETSEGILTDPATALDNILIMLGIVAGVATAAAVAGFLTSGSSTEAAKVGGIVGFLSAIGLVVVNILLDAQPIFDQIPYIGPFLFLIGAASTFVILLYTAAGFISGGGAY